MISTDISVDLPADWGTQIEIWSEARGVEWRDCLEQWFGGTYNGRVINWTRERFCEIIYLWDECGQIAVQIARHWIKCGYLPDTHDDDHRGSVDGMIRRMMDSGLVRSRAKYPSDRVKAARSARSITGQRDSSPTPPVRRPTTREIVEMRRQRVLSSGGAFEQLSREERGMPTIELAPTQHPDHPDGVTHDSVFRQMNGRTTIFTVDERRRLAVYNSLSEAVRMMKQLAEQRPTVSDFHLLRPNERDMIQHFIGKSLPEIMDFVAFLEHLTTLRATVVTAPVTEPVVEVPAVEPVVEVSVVNDDDPTIEFTFTLPE